MYRGCQVSMCPPPLTINWWPRDHLPSRLVLPMSFLHKTCAGSCGTASATSCGCSVSRTAVPVRLQTVSILRRAEWVHMRLVTACKMCSPSKTTRSEWKIRDRMVYKQGGWYNVHVYSSYVGCRQERQENIVKY